MKVLNYLLNIFKVYGFKIIDIHTATSILRDQLKNINDEIFNYVQDVVCPKISAPDKVKWTYLNLSRDSLWITAKDRDMSFMPGGTISINYHIKSNLWDIPWISNYDSQYGGELCRLPKDLFNEVIIGFFKKGYSVIQNNSDTEITVVIYKAADKTYCEKNKIKL